MMIRKKEMISIPTVMELKIKVERLDTISSDANLQGILSKTTNARLNSF